jgi:hypothetical protein
MLAAQDGSFELAPCNSPNGSTTCTRQTTTARPVLWVNDSTPRHPYALIGSDQPGYTISVDAMVPQPGSAGLLGRYRAVSASHGTYNAYTFDVSTNGTFTLKVHKGGTAASTISGQRQLTPPTQTVLARGHVPFAPRQWHRLSLTVAGTAIKAGVDGQQVASLTDATLTHGIPGIETGGWYPAYFSHLTITDP